MYWEGHADRIYLTFSEYDWSGCILPLPFTLFLQCDLVCTRLQEPRETVQPSRCCQIWSPRTSFPLWYTGVGLYSVRFSQVSHWKYYVVIRESDHVPSRRFSWYATSWTVELCSLRAITGRPELWSMSSCSMILKGQVSGFLHDEFCAVIPPH